MEKGENAFFPRPDRRMLRRMGLLRDQQGILNRYFREQGNWNEHLDATRNYILEWLEATRPVKLLVMGSGWLLDFPLEEAVRLCPSILFADLNHPAQIERKLRTNRGVSVVTADITGGMLNLAWKALRSPKKTSHELVSEMNRFEPAWNLPENTAFLSLNLLSQVDTLIVDPLIGNGWLTEEDALAVRAKIQGDHLRLLQHSNFCLITDYYEIHEHKNQALPSGKELLHIPLPKNFEKEWVWKFDSHRLYKSSGNILFKVGAMSY
jgi:hypothetical protein